MRSLRRELDTDYFERLLRELVLESGHCALTELVPHEAAEGDVDPEVAELAELRAQMSADDLAAVQAEVDALRTAQEAEDTPEAKATLAAPARERHRPRRARSPPHAWTRARRSPA